MLAQIGLSFLVLLLCAGAVAALALVLTWQERAPTPDVRRRLLLGLVLPVTGLVGGVVLGSFTLLLLLWSPGGAEVLAAL